MIKKMSIFNNDLDILDIINDFVFCLLHIMDSDNIVIKGCIALTAASYKYNVDCKRSTRDLDLQVLNYSKWINFRDDLSVLNEYSRLDMKYSLEKYISKGDPISYEKLTVIASKNTKDYKFTIDVQVADFNYKKENYKIYTLDFDGSAVETMLADKLNVLKDRTVFRRAKDIYDIYLISRMKKFELLELVKILKEKRDLKCDCVAFLDLSNINDIEHAYNKLVGKTYEKLPEFEEIYPLVVSFIAPIFDTINGKSEQELYWDGRAWQSEKRL